MKHTKKTVLSLLVSLSTLLHAENLNEPTSSATLAKDLVNPVSSLISLPFQFNYDRGFKNALGDKGNKITLNIQPVIPFELNENWNLISRTILPIIRTDNMPGLSGIHGGVGDITQSFFFSPVPTSKEDWIWGAGPIFLIPTKSDLSADTWGAGPTAVVLKQEKSWTYGMLANHIWSIDSDFKINQTLLQPFLTYTTSDAFSYSLITESTYNWESPSDERWTVPIAAMVSKVSTIGNQNVSYALGVKYYAKSPEGGPTGWGFRFATTFIFPK